MTSWVYISTVFFCVEGGGGGGGGASGRALGPSSEEIN